MSFLDSIRGFEKKGLRSTSTSITTIGGRQYIETREGDRVKTELVSEGALGFVGDVKPDLQVGEILPGLIVGSQDVASDRDLLKHHKVTHVLNVASMVENHFPEHFTYKKIEILDIPETDIAQYFQESFPFIDLGRTNGCVLVHCNAGISRSASIVIGYLIKREHMTFQQAFDLVKSRRPATRPNEGFLRQLKVYSERCSIEN